MSRFDNNVLCRVGACLIHNLSALCCQARGFVCNLCLSSALFETHLCALGWLLAVLHLWSRFCSCSWRVCCCSSSTELLALLKEAILVLVAGVTCASSEPSLSAVTNSHACIAPHVCSTQCPHLPRASPHGPCEMQLWRPDTSRQGVAPGGPEKLGGQGCDGGRWSE